jgi:DHA1 family bicyclomycin/chloramphenicol resistance-like MFS transporter
MRLTPSRAAAPAPRVPLALAASTLALLLGLQPVSTDVFMPALPMLTRALGAPLPLVQLTMAALILAFGLAQIGWGPLADRYGRRPVLLAGLSLFVLASLGCLLSGSAEALVGWRALQGAALAAAVVCARAIVRDLYEPVQGAQVMALALSGLGAIALTGPLIGGLAAQVWGWRGPLAVVSLAGALTLAFVALRWPETLAPPGFPKPAAAAPWRAWWAIMRNPDFRAWALLVACSYGGLFTVLASSSFVFMDVLGLAPSAYGGVMALGSASYIAGTFVCRRWIRRFGLAGTVRRGAALTLLSGAASVLAALAAQPTWWALLLGYGLYAFGHGLHQPCGQTGVVGPFPRSAGVASAWAGLLLALVAFGVSRWLGGALDGTVRPMAFGVAFWAALTCAMAWGPVQRLGSA